MATLINRTTKGSPLTTAEFDQNFTNINQEITNDNYPVLDPSLMLDFVNQQQLDPRCTFARASAATCVNEFGYIDTLAANQPRIEYDPVTLRQRGLLIEEQRTNLIPYSEKFDETGTWATQSAAVFSNTTLSPDGNIDADKLVATAINDVHFLQYATTVTAGLSYSMSCFAKAAEYPRITLLCGVPGWASQQDATFDLVAGTVSSVSSANGTSASIQNMGNGWYRCIMVPATAASTVFSGFRIYLHNGTSLTFTGDGTSGAFIWGAQMEAGSFATSYIPSVVTFTSRTSTATYFDSAGTLQSAANNIARLSYNPDNLYAQPTLLLEPQRINSIRNNTMQNVGVGTPGTLPTNWGQFVSATAVTLASIASSVLNGINYIDVKFSGTATSAGEISIYPEQASSLLFPAGTVLTASAWCAIVGGSTSNITSTTLRTISYNGATYLNEVSTAMTLTPSMVRFTRTFTSSAGSDRVLMVVTANAAGAGPVDITVRIGLPQLEQGSYATSVIPTTAATVTRSADVSTSQQSTRNSDSATFTSITSWFNSQQSSFYAEFLVPQLNRAARLFAVDDGTLNNMIDGTISAANGVAIEAVSATVYGSSAGPTNVVTASVAQKIVFTFNFSANETACLNGGTVGSANITLPVATLTRLLLGRQTNGVELCGWIRRIVVYPRQLTAAQLQALTG